MKKTHIFHLSVRLGTVLSGIQEPLEECGLGSFVQRGGSLVFEARPQKRKCTINCKFVKPIDDVIYIQVTQSIKQGRELFMSYGQGVTV